jgi:hypothetical protein
MNKRFLLFAGLIAGVAAVTWAQQSTYERHETTQQTENGTTTTTTTTVSGTVQSLEAGKSITITDENGQNVTYVINEQSDMPKTVTVGKTVTVYTTKVAGSEQPVVKSVKIKVKTKKHD